MSDVVLDDPYARLVEAVQAAKGDAPLKAVTVVTPSFAVSRDVLRYLAREIGVANTTVLTASQLVEHLARPVLIPRMPLPYSLLVGSVRRVLTESPGRFAEVADQTITARALANASQWLGAHPSLEGEGCNRVVSEVLRIHRDASGRHADQYFLRHQEIAAAEAHLDQLGSAIVFLPNERDPAMAAFLKRVLGDDVPVNSTAVATGTMVLHASDADDEVRAVVRLVRDRLAKGIPGHRIGVFYGSEKPYLSALLTHFKAAGIDVAGTDACGLGDGAPARSLLRLLRMDPNSILRREVLAILAERAVRWTGEDGPFSLRQAELLTRHAEPIVGGEDWERLRPYAEGDQPSLVARSLLALVESLRASLAAVGAARTWAEAADAVSALLDTYFVGGQKSGRGPASPRNITAQRDLEALSAIVDDLRSLAGVGPEPTVAGIIDAIEVGVEAVRWQVGEFGSAVSVGSISEGSGRDLDISIIVGMAEGIVPNVRREDPLLPESITGVSQADQLRLQHRALELAIAAGRKERILSFPRGSLRGGAEKVPSRWLLPTLRFLAGEQVSESNWGDETKGCASVVVVKSFDAGMRVPDDRLGESPATGAEWRARADDAASGDDEMAGIITLARELRSDRQRGHFTRFTGNVKNVADLIDILDNPIAPTRLEEWISSPYLFFIQRILGVAPLEDPDEDMQIDPLRRGDLVHKILEDYVKQVMQGADGGLEQLLSIGDARLQEATDRAPGWLPQVWERNSREIRADLRKWFELDAIERAQGWVPIGAETGFGGTNGKAVSLDLAHGTMQFLGKVDRIDQHTDGRVRVTDYKTGSSKYSTDLVEANPTANTTKFQLPVYGLLGRTMSEGATVTARYWFATARGEFKPIGYPITDQVIEILRRDLSFCQQSIRDGMFPPKRGSLSVRALGELLGATELDRTWHALRHDQRLSGLVRIHEGEGL